MNSPFMRETSEACFHGCCLPPLLCLHRLQSSSKSSVHFTLSELKFAEATASSLHPNSPFTNHESLPSLQESFSFFIKAYSLYAETNQADRIRAREYDHLALSNHVCLDYIGQGLFSYAQQRSHQGAAVASSSTSPSSLVCSSESPFFSISYKPVRLNFQELFGGQESELESQIRKRITTFMNVSETEYNVVFTANQSSAFKVLADSYPFESNKNLVTAYDYQSEAVDLMTEISKKKGARVMSAEFSWPNLPIISAKLENLLVSKRKKKKKRGLFVFPLQSRMTGARYSYQWMSIAQENGWHVLLDASALGPKDMETLGLSLFKPDFLICSFYKTFGEDPSGFGCLFVKKTSVSVLQDLTAASNICIVRLIPASNSSPVLENSEVSDLKIEENPNTRPGKDDLGTSSSSSGRFIAQQTNDESSYSQEIEEVSVERELHSSHNIEIQTPRESGQSKNREGSEIGSSEIECRGLDHADSLGLILISCRTRYLINWLINALTSLHHPNREHDFHLVKIYGPTVRIYRGPAMAFNIFDWKGEKIDPITVQKLADRNNISLNCGYLSNIWFPEKNDEEKELIIEKRKDKRSKNQSKISVVSASIGLMTNFEDVFRVWGFVSRFLDADFVEREKWRYRALNQNTVEV